MDGLAQIVQWRGSVRICWKSQLKDEELRIGLHLKKTFIKYVKSKDGKKFVHLMFNAKIAYQ